ncbi:FKBP-type peptidylprolyl isomerase [Natrinema pallidum DSM 3751]|uniref:peptidylprolyl isomerase n=2 Tax=Natrinema pallidum TaxID=69527 RepID=L9YLN0_9EURY|nr:FKBP-type peptidylprolyl isomerase [Natrinema pallidum DSM 3751]
MPGGTAGGRKYRSLSFENVVLKCRRRDVQRMTEDQEAELEEQADDVDEAGAEEDADGLQEGDFVELEYTAYTTEDEQLVDTTDPEVAEEEGVDEQGQEFKPRTIVVGEGHIFEAVENDIVGSEPGDSGTVIVPAEDAFGEYDPDDVQTVSAEKIDEDDRYPGANVQIDGQQGYISTIIGGRARVDFNHPLAGDDVEYEYTIADEVDDREQQAAGLFEMYLGMEPELWIETDEVEEEVPVEPDDDEDEDAEPEFETETVEKETLYLEATPQMTMNQQWMMGKQQIGQDIIEKVGVDRVIVQEVIDGMGGMGMGGMMGGMGGMGGGDIEEALEDADVDADEIVDELEGAEE